MMWPFKRKCDCHFSDSCFELVEEYRSGPWQVETWTDPKPFFDMMPVFPKIGITRHVEGKWECRKCGTVKVFDRRYIHDPRWGYADLMEPPRA